MTSRTTRSVRLLAAASAAVLAQGLLVPTATATSAEETAATASALAVRRVAEREGQCRSGPGEWELKVRRRPRHRLKIEFKVDEIIGGQRWQIFVSDDGRRVAAVSRVSTASSGVRVRARTRNRRGRDRIVASAVNSRNGNTCTGRLRF